MPALTFVLVFMFFLPRQPRAQTAIEIDHATRVIAFRPFFARSSSKCPDWRSDMDLLKGLTGLPSLAFGVAIIAMTPAGPGARPRALVPAPAIVTGSGAGMESTVRVFEGATGQRSRALKPFGDGVTVGARVAVGDVNADGTPDLVVAAAPGASPLVKILDASTDRFWPNSWPTIRRSGEECSSPLATSIVMDTQTSSPAQASRDRRSSRFSTAPICRCCIRSLPMRRR